MPPAKVLNTVMLPKANGFRVKLPKGSKFLGISLLTDPEVQKTTTPASQPWDSPEWPVLHYMHDVLEKEFNYHSLLICPMNSITEPMSLHSVGSFTVFGCITFHVFEIPDNQEPPNPETTTSHPTS